MQNGIRVNCIAPGGSDPDQGGLTTDPAKKAFVDTYIANTPLKRWANEEGQRDIELKLNDVIMLDEVLDRYAKGIVFSIRVEDIDENFCQAMETMVNKHKGNTSIALVVEDVVNDLSLRMMSEKKVNIKVMLQELKKIDKIRKIEIEK